MLLTAERRPDHRPHLHGRQGRALGEQFATRRLGPLAARDPVAARLRTTLEAYFAAQESPGATARKLGLHMNTVLYRLRQAEELLGLATTPPSAVSS